MILTNATSFYQTETWPKLASSDHAVVFAHAPLNRYKISKPSSIKRLVRAGKIRFTVHKIRSTDWSPILNKLNYNPQGATDDLYSTILSAENYCQPLKICKFKDDQPWMTLDIKNFYQKTPKLFHSEKKDEWKKTSNEVKLQIRKRKKEYYHKKFILGIPTGGKS